jgi:hypothetical protein
MLVLAPSQSFQSLLRRLCWHWQMLEASSDLANFMHLFLLRLVFTPPKGLLELDIYHTQNAIIAHGFQRDLKINNQHTHTQKKVGMYSDETSCQL